MPARARAVPPLVPRSGSKCGLVRSGPLTVERHPEHDRSNTLQLLTACIAHEVKQPLSGIMANASTCLRMLNADPPNVEGARDTALRTLRDVNRAAEVTSRLATLFEKKEPAAESVANSEPAADPFGLNQLVLDAVALAQADLYASCVTATFDLENDLYISGDRIQLQQVLLNLVRNACEAMNAVDDRARTLTIATCREGKANVRVSVRDVGAGFADKEADKLFTPFYTTKVHGMGIGLCLSRSIIRTHRGRLWGMANTDGPGATFCIVIPCKPASQHRDVAMSGRADAQMLEVSP